MAEHSNGKRQFAEIAHFKGCFSLRPRKAPIIEVLTDETAADRVLKDEAPSLLWLSVQTGALYISERYGVDVIKQQLPLKLEVAAMEQPTLTPDKELLVASITFSDRHSLELFVKLGQHVLQEWLSIRQGALGKCLLVSHGHWLLGYRGKAVQLQSTAGGLSGLLQLNLHKPCVELWVQQASDSQTQRCETVSSLTAAAKALQRFGRRKQQPDSRVISSIQQLRPTAPAVEKLLRQIHASAERQKGAPTMASWTSGGILAAIVDCAASHSCNNFDSSDQQQQSHSDQLGSSCNGAIVSCSRPSAVIQGLAQCACLVLSHAGEQQCQQAQLLMQCISRGLSTSSSAQSLQVAALLNTMVQNCKGDGSGLSDILCQAGHYSLVLQHLLWCYSRSCPAPSRLQQQSPLHLKQDLQAHFQDVGDAMSDFAQDPAHMAAGPQSHPIMMSGVSDVLSELDSPRQTATAARQLPGSASSISPRKPVVPRLSFPASGPGTPTTVIRSSRLSRRASENSSAVPDLMGQSASHSAIAALQQLGHSCGESVMASDLAAFVTHKQLHSGQAYALQHGRRALPHSAPGDLSARSYSGCTVKQLGEGQMASLPLSLRLQLCLLECIGTLTSHPAAQDMPMPAKNILLEQLLVPKAVLLQQIQTVRGTGQLGSLGRAFAYRRQLTLQVLLRCLASESVQRRYRSTQDDDTRDTGPRLHNSLIAQFQQRLLEYCLIKRPDDSVHEACREVLLLLKDVLVNSADSSLTEAACAMMGRVLGQQEYMLRTSRVSLWSRAAVRHMDALVQLYAALVNQATSAAAATALLQTLGSQPAAGNSTSSGGGRYSIEGAAAMTSAPADTLQLVLEYLQQRLPAAVSSSDARIAQPVAAVAGLAGASPHSASSSRFSTDGVSHVGGSLGGLHAGDTPGKGHALSAREQQGSSSTPGNAAAECGLLESHAYNKHCWQLLTAIVDLAARRTLSPGAAAASAFDLSCGGDSSPACSSQPGSEAGGASRWGYTAGPDHGFFSIDRSARHPQQAQPLASPRRLQPLASRRPLTSHQLSDLQGFEVSSPRPPTRLSTGTGLLSSRRSESPVPALPTAMSFSLSSLTGSSAGGAGCISTDAASETLKVLVELLIRHKGGRPYVVQQLEDLDGSQSTIPLQLELLHFLAQALAVPQSYALNIPQLLEFYVHYHFLHFTRHYHKLTVTASPAVVACCKGHIKVLLALSRHAGGANLVRRRFLQLKVLEFVIRELSLEYNLLQKQQLGPSCSSSHCSTPQTSSRSLAAANSARRPVPPSSSSATPGTARLPTSRLGSAALTTLPALVQAEDDAGLLPAANMASPLPQADQAAKDAQLQQQEESAEDSAAHHGSDAAASTAAEELPAPCSLQEVEHVSSSTDSRPELQPLQRSSSPELHKAAAGRQAPGIASYSRVVARQQQHRRSISPATGNSLRRKFVKQTVRKFEEAAAAAAAAASPLPAYAGRPVPGHQPIIAANATPSAAQEQKAGCSSSLQVLQQPVRQQAFAPRPPGAPSSSSTATAATSTAPADAQMGRSSSSSNPDAMITQALAATLRSGGRLPDGQLHHSSDSNANHASINESHQAGSSSSGSHRSVSPESDLLESSSPVSTSSRLCQQQPVLTGDASVDYGLITEWEEQTGRDFVFDGLSDDDEAHSGASMDEPVSNRSHAEEAGNSTASPPASGCTVPSLALRLPNSFHHALGDVQASAAVPADTNPHTGAADESDGSSVSSGYRPGFDLEDDFERMMQAEESGEAADSHAWRLSSSDSHTSDSSYIPAGRQLSDGQSEGSPSPRIPYLSTDTRQQGFGVGANEHCELTAAAAAAVEGVARQPNGNPAAAADEAAQSDTGAWGDEGELDMHDGDWDDQRLVTDTHRSHAVVSLQDRSPVKSSIVPPLNLKAYSTVASHLQQQLIAAAPGSSAGSGSSLMSLGISQAPSLLATATPLITTRPPTTAAAAGAVPAPANGVNLTDRARQACQSAAGHQSSAAAAGYGLSALYQTCRQASAVYADQELHVLCVELALHLLGTPTGQLDQLQLPQEPSDASLQHKVLVLLEHLSHPDNTSTVHMLAQHAEAQQQQQQVPASSHSMCGRAWMTDADSGVSSSNSAAAGLASCALRLLKLLSNVMLSTEQLQKGVMIQQGAFSEIHAGTLTHGGRPVAVALKTVECGDSDPSCFERVYNEVAILESLKGQNGIVPLLDYGVMCDPLGDVNSKQRPQWVLVFPRYSGSLREWRINRGQGLQHVDVELCLRVFLQVTTIVRDLHSANIVHYDIKGDNLLLDFDTNPEGSGSTSAKAGSKSSSKARLPFRVILADFGDALMTDTAGSPSERHRGTELFSSPEMLLLHAGQLHPEHYAHDRRKHRGVGSPHDVWSMGCTLYELLTGTTLFQDQGVGRITSYAMSSNSWAGPTAAAHGAVGCQHNSNSLKGRGSDAGGMGTIPGGSGVLNESERSALGGHRDLINLVEFMLVGDVAWRPSAAEVVCRVQQVLLTYGR